MPRSRNKSAVRRYHDRVAPRYDASYDDAYWQWHDTLTWRYLKPYLPRNVSAPVVDLGCGTGKWAARLAKSGYPVTCVDIAPKMLDQARSKLAPTDPSRRARFVQADLADLRTVDAGSYALAVALGDPIGSADSPLKAMKQIRRILTPDGVLVATFDNKLAALEFYLSTGNGRRTGRFLRDGKTHWLTKDAAERFPIHTFAPGELPRLAEKSGFDVIEMIGKTVLPMRHYRHLLETPEDRRRWAKLEMTLCRDSFAIGRASHLQVALRVAHR